MKYRTGALLIAVTVAGCSSPTAPTAVNTDVRSVVASTASVDATPIAAARNSPARDAIVINHGEIRVGESLVFPQGPVWLQGTRGFRVNGSTGTIGAFGWAECFVGCAPGTVISIGAVWADAWAGTVTVQGRTTTLGGAATDETAHIVIAVEGSVVAPRRGPDQVIVTAPFTLARGSLTVPRAGGMVPLTSRRDGTAHVRFQRASGEDEGWYVKEVRYIFRP